MKPSGNIWKAVDLLLKEHEIVIDRPKGTAHPRYPDYIYKVDYGYLKGTKSSDGREIDVYKGTSCRESADALLCQIDLEKKDMEMKILVNCTDEEKQIILDEHNEGGVSSILIHREDGRD